MPCKRVAPFAQQLLFLRVRATLVFDVGKVEKAHHPALGIEPYDEKILAIHQRVDNFVDSPQKVGHVQIGTRKISDREQGALQVFRTRKLLVRILDPRKLQRLEQSLASLIEVSPECLAQQWRHLSSSEAKQQQGACMR